MAGTPQRRLPEAEEAPLRSALYSADQMERHGEDLARAHKLRPGRRPGPRSPRPARYLLQESRRDTVRLKAL